MSTSAYDTAVLADSPVGYWKLNENVGATTVADSASSPHTGTVHATVTFGGTGLIDSDTDTAPAFNGSTGYIDMATPAALSITGQVTMEAIIKVAAFPTGANLAQFIGRGWDGANLGYFMDLLVSNGQVIMRAGSYNGTAHEARANVSAWAINERHHVAGRYNGTKWDIFFDGALISSKTSATGAVAGTGKFVLGNCDGLSRFFNGVIERAAVYNTGISDARILVHAQAYSAGLGTTPDLTAWTGTKTVAISNAGQAAISAVQARVVLDAVNFDGWGSVNSTGSDIRFLDGTTALPFWIQRWNSTTQVAEIYVKLDLPNSSSKAITLKYGKSGAVGTGNYDLAMTKGIVDADTLCLLHCDEGTGAPVDAASLVTWTAVNTPTWGTDDGGNWRSEVTRVCSSGGSYVIFNGSTQQLTASGFLDAPPSAFSLSFWFQVTSNTTAMGLFAKKTVASPEDSLQISFQGGTQKSMQWARKKAGTLVVGNSTSAYGSHPILNINTWYHGVFTSGANGIRCFINGEVDLSIPTETSALAAGSADIARLGKDLTNFLSGALDEVQFFSRQLSNQEVYDLFTRRKHFARSTQYTKLTRSGSNSVITATIAGEQLDVPAIEEICVRYNPASSKRIAFYHGSAGSARLIRATSSDGITWGSKAVVLGGGTSGEAGGVFVPEIYPTTGNIASGDTLYCFYTTDELAGVMKYATSTDLGATWTVVGTAVNITGAVQAGIVKDGSTWHFVLGYYISAKSIWRLGYARGTLGSINSLVVDETTYDLNLQLNSGSTGGTCLRQIGNYWYAWNLGNRTGSVFPSFCYCKRAVVTANADLGLAGPWVEVDGPIVQAEDGVSELSQAADIEVNDFGLGAVEVMWEGVKDAAYPSLTLITATENLGTYAGTMAQFVADSAEPSLNSYTVSGTPTGLVNVASTAVTVTLAFAANGIQSITLTSSNAADTLTASDSTTGTHTITVTPVAGATSFTYTITRHTAGTSTITYTNGQGWTDAGNTSYTPTAVTISVDETIINVGHPSQTLHVHLVGATGETTAEFTLSDGGTVDAIDPSDPSNPILTVTAPNSVLTATLTHVASGATCTISVVNVATLQANRVWAGVGVGV